MYLCLIIMVASYRYSLEGANNLGIYTHKIKDYIGYES